MKAILQRVLSASVVVDKQVVSSIQKGILVFAAMAPGDTEKEADSLAADILKLKLWDGEDGSKWKRTVADVDGEVLCVSQFTLFAAIKKGKPSFHRAMPGDDAKLLYDYFVKQMRAGFGPDKVKDGVFQAMMECHLVNDGPVTLELVANPPQLAEDKQSKKPG